MTNRGWYVSLVCAFVLMNTRAATQEPPPRVWNFLHLPETSSPIARWMKAHRWDTQRGDPKRFRVGPAGLEMVSRDDSVAIGLRLDHPIDSRQWPRIRFRFRIDRVPTGTNLKKKSGDDAAFRLYVAFDRDDGWFHPPHTIAYAWTENVAPGTIIPSAHFTQLRYLSVGRGSGRDEAGAPRWITIERDLLKDYRRAFPDADARVPAIVGLLLKCDSNNTDTRAGSTVTSIQLLQPRR